MASPVKPFRVETRGHFHVSARDLWPLVSDTPRLNRAIGLPPVYYSVKPNGDGGTTVTAEYRLAGLPFIRWTEEPFEWQEGRAYSVERRYHWGPVARVRGGLELVPANGGTDAIAFADVYPRNIFGVLFGRLVIGDIVNRRVIAQCRAVERSLLGKGASPFSGFRGQTASDRLDELCGRLQAAGADATIVGRLRRHLREAADEDVFKMRPFEMADRWGTDRRATLIVFLQATVVGLLELSWNVLCPNCRIGKATYSSLKDLKGQAHCEACNITFEADFDRLVEVRFSPAPSVRKVSLRQFCIGGPMNTPHVVGQLAIDSGRTGEMDYELEAGEYRLRSGQSAGVALLDVGAGAASGLEIAVGAEGMVPERAAVAAGGVALRAVNRTNRRITVALESGEWPDTAATGAVVSTLQEFRDLFSHEVLSPGLELTIGNLTFLFTDLTGSTALYRSVGQARAFRLVQDHFVILGRAIQRNRGALVKTIGDAVMAVFHTDGDAMRAALAIQRAIGELDTGGTVDPTRLVKIGIHGGPCLAVNLNDRLDYFGTTVNLASRVEHECTGGEIAATAEVCSSPAVRRILDDAHATRTPREVWLKGIAEPVTIYRIAVRDPLTIFSDNYPG